MDSVPWPTSSRAIVASFLENYVYMVELHPPQALIETGEPAAGNLRSGF